ncbi:hypothetical protein GIV29_28385 [Pseudomonas carnis]|nr:hypothetical protein [Pseudomonas carnis]
MLPSPALVCLEGRHSQGRQRRVVHPTAATRLGSTTCRSTAQQATQATQATE